ncbi:hypothetical protein Tco_1445241, partial [Tanacetum coccineum]
MSASIDSPSVNTESSTVKKSKALETNTEAGSSSLKKKDKHRKGTESVKFRDVQPPPKGVHLNVLYFGYESFQTPFDATKGVGEGPSGTNKTTGDGVEKKKEEVGNGFLNDPLLRPASPTTGSPLKVATDSSHSLSWTQGMLNATNQCPFTGMPLQTDSDSHGHHHHSCGHHWKRHGRDNNAIGMGSASDYVRIDRPMHGFRHHVPFKVFYDPYMADDHPQNEPWHGVDHVELK